MKLFLDQTNNYQNCMKMISSKMLALTLASIGLSLFSVFHLTAQEKQVNQGELYQGLTKAIPEGRVIYPYGLEVTYHKTSHLIFPSAIRYVDLGSSNIVAGKANDAENVLRVKAAIKDFETETSLSVICDDGSYYAFNVKYADEPDKLNVEMQDFLHSTGGQRPTNRADIYFKDLGSSAPVLVQLINNAIWQNNDKLIRHIGARQFGMQFQLRGMYTHNGLIYFHLLLENKNHVPYNIDYVSFRVVDRDTAKRTATQELVLQPLRTYNERTHLGGKAQLRTIYVLEQFTLSEGKQLEVTVHEYNGGRTLTFVVQNEDLVRAKNISNLKLRF